MAFQLLDPKDEEELFKTRLLNVEEKPLKRITKRLATVHRVLAASAVQEATPPPESEDGKEGREGQKDAEDTANASIAATIAQLREDITLDFAAFDASISRLQSLAAANARERARYADRRAAIDETCGGVRAQMVSLRAQLEAVRATLQQRRAFDALADEITRSRSLWPRPDQQAAIVKFEEECRQLERESAAYSATWRERKQQFARIMDESMRLRRLIRDEKEEVERREGMDDEEGGGSGAGGQAVVTTDGGKGGSGSGSGAGTAAGAGTGAAGSPMPTSAADSPAPASNTLRPDTALTQGGSRAPSRLQSREATPAATPAPAPALSGDGDGDDVDMVDTSDGAAVAEGTASVTPAADTPAAATPANEARDKMDTT